MKIIGSVKFTNPDRIVFEKSKITKEELAIYYYDIAPLMLKYIKRRPITAFRCHGGINGECFFKKHPAADKDNVSVALINGDEYYFLKDSKQLLFQVQMGTIEFHTWGCKAPNFEKPDMMVFDFDPADDVSLGKLRKGVMILKSLLDELGLESKLKTSGGKGYHVIVFIEGKNWSEFSLFAEQIAVLLEQKYPEMFTTNMRKNKRSKKIFIDYLRNKKGASCVAPFSVRAREGAPISFPISFENIGKIKPNEINIRNYKKYMKFLDM